MNGSQRINWEDKMKHLDWPIVQLVLQAHEQLVVLAGIHGATEAIFLFNLNEHLLKSIFSLEQLEVEGQFLTVSPKNRR